MEKEPCHTFKVGDMAILNCRRYNEWPQIGQICTLQDNKASIKWYSGSISTEWTPCMISVGKFVREVKEDLWLHELSYKGWQLPQSKKLPKCVKEECLKLKGVLL